jgi:hypothetical protein
MDRSQSTENRPLEKRLWLYNVFGRRKVQGWFSRIDAEIFPCILLEQEKLGISGSTAEIGVHHGSSFVPLCIALRRDEKAVAIDVFEDQHLNMDQSGAGDYNAFMRTLRKNSVPAGNVCVIKSTSLGLDPRIITDACGPIRFFSIDGGHWREVVKNDLEIAEKCRGDGCVIALDDFYSTSYPDVTLGFMDWFREGGEFVPLAIGYGKLFLCESAHRGQYIQAISSNKYLQRHFRKMHNFLGVEIPLILGARRGIRIKIEKYIRDHYPKTVSALKRVR